MSPMLILPVFALVVLFALAIVVFLIVVLIRAVSRSSSSSPGGFASPVNGIGTQVGVDGFWIFSCPCDPGSILHYHFWANGVRRAGRVPYQPGADGRQFIYTGERPERVAIVQVDELDTNGIVIVPPPIIEVGGPFWGSAPGPVYSGPMDSGPPAPPSSGFPSAY